jgi:hypothetical protein
VDNTGDHGVLDTDDSFTTLDLPGAFGTMHLASMALDRSSGNFSRSRTTSTAWPRPARRRPNRPLSRSSASG